MSRSVGINRKHVPAPPVRKCSVKKYHPTGCCVISHPSKPFLWGVWGNRRKGPNRSSENCDHIVLHQTLAPMPAQGKIDEAAPLLERSLAIHEKALGPEHPSVAISLTNSADLLAKQARTA